MSFTPPFLLLDRYEVSAELGRGGQSVVYRARDRVLKRDVAIKLLREDALSEQMLARFRQEMDVSAQLEHAHILHVYDTGSYQGVPFIVMELAPGQTLADRLKAERQLPVTDALQIAREVGLALGHAHDRGIVHRDVKPDNILLGAGGALLADFGIARLTGDSLALHITSTGTAVGTLLYMSPEQLCAEPEIDSRSDQYSLACVLYEMLAGVGPHIASTFEGLRLLRMSGRHSPVRMHRTTVPPVVERAIEIALSPMSADRFRTMGEFLSAIGASASADYRVSNTAMPAVGTLSHAEPVPSSAQTQSRRRRILLGAAALTLVAGGVATAKWDRTAAPAPHVASDLQIHLLPVSSPNAPSTSMTPIVDAVGNSLRDELNAWRGLTRIDREVGRRSDALMLRTVVSSVNDSLRLQLELEGGAQPVRVERFISRAEAAAPSAIVHALLTEALVRYADSTSSPLTVPGAAGIPDRSYPALKAYVSGFRALRAGEFDSAYSQFDRAAGELPRFGAAHYWAAQAGAWVDNAPRGWRDHATRAARSALDEPVDSLLADGLVRLAQGEYLAACASYRHATQLAASRFDAWFGLGECQRLDSIVLLDGMETRFRSSHWAALGAYRRAATLSPSSEMLGALMTRIIRVTYAEGTRTRRGRGASNNSDRFTSLVSLIGDTLAHVPIPDDRFAGSPVPATWSPAVRRGQSLARDITQAAVEQWPQSPSLWVQRALALEFSGIVGRLGDGRDAGSALARAESVAVLRATSGETAVRIAVANVRLALRRGDFQEAGLRARETLQSARTMEARGRWIVQPLALLLGDVAAAERLSVPANGVDPLTPPVLADSIELFNVRALSGACSSLSQNRSALEKMFSAQFAGPELSAQRSALLLEPYLAAVPCLGTVLAREFESPILIHRIYRTLADSNRVAARALLDTLRQSRRNATAASVTWDAIYAESWAAVQAGDTVGARAQLTDAITNIANMSRFTLDQPAQAAGLRRGLALLVDIADPRTADPRWAAWSRALSSR